MEGRDNVSIWEERICDRISLELDPSKYGDTDWPRILDLQKLRLEILDLKQELVEVIQDPTLCATWSSLDEKYGIDACAVPGTLKDPRIPRSVSAGYYGPQGERLIRQTLISMLHDEDFDHSTLTPFPTFDLFLRRILVPHAATLLIAKNHSIAITDAVDWLESSVDYGKVAFPLWGYVQDIDTIAPPCPLPPSWTEKPSARRHEPIVIPAKVRVKREKINITLDDYEMPASETPPPHKKRKVAKAKSTISLKTSAASQKAKPVAPPSAASNSSAQPTKRDTKGETSSELSTKTAERLKATTRTFKAKKTEPRYVSRFIGTSDTNRNLISIRLGAAAVTFVSDELSSELGAQLTLVSDKYALSSPSAFRYEFLAAPPSHRSQFSSIPILLLPVLVAPQSRSWCLSFLNINFVALPRCRSRVFRKVRTNLLPI
ncbi:hypothetical protein PUNSTDRAFT_132152 [Punctularia strigosozonata HHB-11173 SS5]|uniref:uncharacterized protein n=1 Tax=Punctularia strigosozonata (strain HHB-11173) TaxID=741275 RepID=UPI0004417C8E|nr:uncharacterized protein PUNSTDRAFT_132152 [Punctularia strigosozonata HHB-11173 SS5]EIN12021.1 hypothetical protein PUNSTDRAFT_132152 [Punctularia strigosozonata HHB-11173 SS5]